MSNAATNLREQARSLRLWSRVGLRAEITNPEVSAAIFEIAAAAIERRQKPRRWMPTRWEAFYLGLMIGSAAIAMMY